MLGRCDQKRQIGVNALNLSYCPGCHFRSYNLVCSARRKMLLLYAVNPSIGLQTGTFRAPQPFGGSTPRKLIRPSHERQKRDIVIFSVVSYCNLKPYR